MSVDYECVKVVETETKKFPDTLAELNNVLAKPVMIIDPDNRASMFFRYSNAIVLQTLRPADMEPENLRKSLVLTMAYGNCLVIDFGPMNTMEVSNFYKEDHFPELLMNKEELFKEENYKKLLREQDQELLPKKLNMVEAGEGMSTEAQTLAFIPDNEFMLVFISSKEPPPPATTSQCVVMKFTDDAESALEEEFGVKKIKVSLPVPKNNLELIEFAFDGETEEVEKLLKKGAYVDSEDTSGHTGLSEAALQGQDETVLLLLKHHANPNTQSNQGRTPCYRAAFNGKASTLKILLEHGGDPDLTDKSNQTAFDVCLNDECRELINAQDREVTAKLKEEWNKAKQERDLAVLKNEEEREAHRMKLLQDRLHTAAKEGDKEGVDDALEDGAPLEGRDDRGNSTLALASWAGKEEMVQFLLEKGAKINSRDEKGWTPLMIATFHGNFKVVKVLLAGGADVDARNSYRKKAVELIQDESNGDAVRREFEAYEAEESRKRFEFLKASDPAAAAEMEKQQAAKDGEGGEKPKRPNTPNKRAVPKSQQGKDGKSKASGSKPAAKAAGGAKTGGAPKKAPAKKKG